jgi:hypothetical protein
MGMKHESSWAEQEFGRIDFGDKRLNERLIKICNRFSDAPESPINQACVDWKETKAAYRFFQNEKVEVNDIIASHRENTVLRAKTHNTVLAIQDTSYFVYSNHPKTEGLGKMSLKIGRNKDRIYSNGLMMHTCLAVTTKGLPIGLFDQKIFTRTLRPDKERRRAGGKYIQDTLPIEEKESYRWLESLSETKKAIDMSQVITVCDREADLYDFFKFSAQIKAPVLVRASQNRTVNRKSRYEKKDVEKLWDYMDKQPEAGSYTIEVPQRTKRKHVKARIGRTATVTVRFGVFQLNPPMNNPKHKVEKLPDIEMNAVHVLEKDPPEGEEPVEWMLLTNCPVTTFAEACEKALWYSLRWRIEMYFKVLKSGFRVETCRLGTAERLARYLAVMSIVAWRLFMITLIARTNPAKPCTHLLVDQEWRVLYMKVNRGRKLPNKIPTIGDTVIWIARLGGYLARKNDGPPGTIVLWRGWKRLTDLTDGWNMASQV